MSDTSNTNLLERASYVSEQYVGTYLPEAIDNLVKSNDLDALEYMVSQAEAELSREEFHNNNILEASDVF